MDRALARRASSRASCQLADLSLDQKQALADASRPADRQPRAASCSKRGGGLPNPDRQKVLDELLPLTKQSGDAAAGKVVFKNQCAKCHMHSGEGTKIGPDLTGMAVHPKHELLVAHHRSQPQRRGQLPRLHGRHRRRAAILNGLLASETKTAIELFDTEAKKHVVLREDIEELAASTKSLMPEGFEKQVKPRGDRQPAGVPHAARQVPAAAAGQGGHGRQHARHVLQRGRPRPSG